MHSIVFLTLLALVSATPRSYHRYYEDTEFQDFFRDEIFDTRRFWREFRREMASLQNVFKRFRGNTYKEGVVGNEYQVCILLRGFDEDDITVKAKQGLLIVQAMKGGPNSGKNFLDVRSLPDFVSEIGQWTYDDGLLNIVFPITGKPKETAKGKSKEDDSDEDSYELDVRESRPKSGKVLNKHSVDSKEDQLVDFKY